MPISAKGFLQPMAKSSSSTATPASRLPSTRESRPALIGLAVLLIVGGALASAWLALQSGNRAYFLQVDREVTQGAAITDDDLRQVSLPEGFEGGVPVSDKASVVGKSAATRLLPGTVLVKEMLSTKAGIEENKTQLTVPVDSSPFVRGLQPGAQLALSVGSDNGGGGGRSAVLAELVSVGRPAEGSLTGSAGDSLPLTVSIDVSCLGVVSQAVQDKSVTPALIGGKTTSVVRATCGA